MLILPFTVFLTTALSLFTMWWAQHVEQPQEFFGGFLGLQLGFNDGIAFGLDIPSPWQERIIVVAICVVIALAYLDRDSRNKLFGYGLILGGAFANLFDRVIDGTVTDIFRVGTFPIFNTADAAISLGVGLLILSMIFDD